ncbi:protein tramtrack, beta isoform-like isoform X2 [Euwallacea fornicatus]|uniref:protein tramtrack, beta isoform-like isoform X2 n=1 Tax=Euwallacea fornicatus TaxID=995702 RepID=UPI00338F434B
MKSPQAKPIRLLQEKHQENLEFMLGNLLRDETLSDITIYCKDGSVKAHKVILAVFSPYFRKVFQDHPDQQVAFMIHGVGVKQIRGLIELIYRGSTEISPELTNKICDIAEEFGIKGIVDENDKCSLNTSGRDTRFKGQKRVAVDFENSTAEPHANKLPKTFADASENKTLKASPVVCASLECPESLKTPKDSTDNPVNLTSTTTSPTCSYMPMSAEARRRTKWALKQRKYKCLLCPASFKRASHLSRHQLVHTGERPFACNHCDKAFSRHDKLKHHIRKTHIPDYIGNYMENTAESDTYTIGHVELDTSHHTEEFEVSTRITREDLLVRMASEPKPRHLNTQKLVNSPDEGPEEVITKSEDSAIPSITPQSSEETKSNVTGQKKGRGRPRKYPQVPKPLIKRPRGRPRINRSVRPAAFSRAPSEATRSEDYDITNMPFGDLEYLTKPLRIGQNSDTFGVSTTRSVEANLMEPLVEIELDQNNSNKTPLKDKIADKDLTVLHHNTAGAFLQNIGLLENSALAKMEIGECTISVSSGSGFC